MKKVEEYLNELNEYTNSINFAERDISKNLEEVLKFNKIISQILEVDTLNTYVMSLATENLVLSRVRKNLSNGNLYTELEKLIYPDPKKVERHGRVNTWRDSIYYCSDVLGTAIFESRPVNEWITTIDIKINKPILNLLVVDPNTKYTIIGKETFTNKDIAFNKFMVNQFKKIVSNDEHHLYLPTAILTKNLIKEFDGIVYPSVASELKGENFAIKPEIFDNYAEVLNVNTLETYNHVSSMDFEVKCIYNSNSFSENGAINWKKVECTGHKIDEKIYH